MASALREVLGATRHYYVLAFEPADVKKKPGELRKLKIRVKRPGFEVSHRAGYTLPDPTTAAATARQLSAAEVIAKGLSGGAFRLSALAVPYRGAGAEVSLPVVLEIDGEGLLDGAGQEPLPLEIYGYAFDGQGHVVDAVGLTPTLDLQALAPSLRGKGVQVLTTFRVPPGPVDLRFLVREGQRGRAASLRVNATVPAFDGADVLSSPLLMDDPRARLVIPTPSRRNPQLQIPFRVEDTAFTPMARGALRGGTPQEVCLLAFGMTPGAGARIEAELVGDAGAPIAVDAGPARVVSDADGVSRVVFTLTPGSLKAGEYRLRAKLVDGARTLASSELPVVVF
jgi:hypothetical protein